MLLLTDILITILLAAIFVQDIKSRAVYWFLFPLLALSFILWQSLKHHSWAVFGYDQVINLGFLLLQLLTVSLWFSVKHKQWVNITSHLLGWGDILFLVSLAFYFSFLNFFAFYIISLIGVLLLWLSTRRVFFKNTNHIPLAGLQALFFLILFIATSFMPAFDLSSDSWIIHLLL